MRIEQIINANALNQYYAGVKGTSFVESAMPSTYNQNFDLKVLKGAKGSYARVLQASNYDVEPMARDYATSTTFIDNKPLYRERMSINEQARADFLTVLATGDAETINAYASDLFEQFAGKTGFLSSVRALNTIQLGQFLCSGTIKVEENGVNKYLDYGLDSDLNVSLLGATTWSKPTATPIKDLQDGLDLLLSKGKTVDVAIMNRYTYQLLANHQTVKTLITDQKLLPSMDNVRTTIEQLTGLKIVIWDDVATVNGTTEKAMKDGFVTLVPNGSLGSCEYGPTPARTDKIHGVADGRTIVDLNGTYATLEVVNVVKGSSVTNIDIVIEALVAINPTIIDSMYVLKVI